MKYRADIDGLRALAINPVLFYHVGVPGFGGGFVGVDIFLVISGYLICGMIDADIRNGTFSLGNFYKRRILRILPALLVMLLVTSVLAYLYFPGAAGAMRRAGVRERDQNMSRMVAAHGATYLSVYDAICRDGRCDEFVQGDVPIQFDAGHLTAQGSIEVGRRLAPLFARKLARTGDASN